ncbi:transposase [Bacillus sp. ISL-4]|nr:transposase [Bacillus sp. ISL-4]MBT2673405.1 transposase [Streptomyces sp. ISL-14]
MLSKGEIENLTGIRPPVVLESTRHCHTPVVQHFEERDYVLIIINQLVLYREKSSSLRKVKTDVIDAYHLYELYNKVDLEPIPRSDFVFSPMLLQYRANF